VTSRNPMRMDLPQLRDVTVTLQVRRHRGRAGRGIGSRPAAVGLRRRDRAQAPCPHAARRDQLRRPRPVVLRPFAARPARREAGEPALIVIWLKLPVDPPMAQRAIDRLRFRGADDAGPLLGKFHPNARAAGGLPRQPGVKRRLIGEAENGKAVAGFGHGAILSDEGQIQRPRACWVNGSYPSRPPGRGGRHRQCHLLPDLGPVRLHDRRDHRGGRGMTITTALPDIRSAFS
jgi:hypothetical protein